MWSEEVYLLNIFTPNGGDCLYIFKVIRSQVMECFIVFMNKYLMSDCKPKLSSAVILGVDEISLCFSGLGNHSHENCP